MSRRGATLAACLVSGLVIAGCASGGVAITQSVRHGTGTNSTTGKTTTGKTTAGKTTAGNTTVADAGGDDGLPAVEPAAWTTCHDYPAPWDCATISVPLDYSDSAGAHLSIAMIRLAAARPSARIGSLLVNPGGPGGSGIALAYGEAQSYPQQMLDSFDIIGFDPRGVGDSSPVLCPASFDSGSGSRSGSGAGSGSGSGNYDVCIPANKSVLPLLGTTNVARDMDMIRRSVGDTQLNFLGYSYGTALGAVFADMFPTRVRAMVLDGAVDPDAGRSNNSGGGIDFYAEQDFDGTIADFEQLCDATANCPAGPHTASLVARVRKKIGELQVDKFPGGGRLSKSNLDDILTGAMYSAFDWPALAFALKDADNGDGSTLAAFSSYLVYGYPADSTSETELDFANIAIRCADFSDRGSESQECKNFPASDEALPVITKVTTSSPILVVGTKGDPATPARYSPLMARALADAVAIEWEGAGHTATLTSRCITALVADYLVALAVPKDGTKCPFVTGTTTLAGSADVVFGSPDRATSTSNIVDVLVALGQTKRVAGCIAPQLVQRSDRRMILDELLGIETPQLIAVRKLIERGCTANATPPGG